MLIPVHSTRGRLLKAFGVCACGHARDGKGGRMASVERNIVNDKLVFTCNNFQSEPGNWGGIIEPMLIAEMDDCNLYLSFLVWNIDTTNYNRLLNYSFWLKKK